MCRLLFVVSCLQVVDCCVTWCCTLLYVGCLLFAVRCCCSLFVGRRVASAVCCLLQMYL